MSLVPQKEVLFLAYYYPPWNTSGVQRATRFVKYLPEGGFSPHVICSSENGSLAGNPAVSHVPNPATERKAGKAGRWAAGIQRAFLPYNEQLPWVPHAVAAAEEVLARHAIPAMISTSPPAGTHIAAMWLKRRHRHLKWVADFRDPMLGNPGRPRKWARPYDSALERAIFSNCDAAIAVTGVVAEEWKNRYPQWAGKFHVVWNGFDPEEVHAPNPIPPGRPRVLLHAGVIYLSRQPFWLASSLERLIVRGRLDPSCFRLRLIGIFQDLDSFRGHPAVAALRARNCLECDGKEVPRRVAMDEVASADYLLILDVANLAETGYTVPAKLYDNIRIGRPILLFTPSGDSPSARILERSGVGYELVHPADCDEEVDRKVLNFLQLPNDPVTPGDWFFETFDGRKQAKMVASILAGLEKG